jgi:hypothetical protein
MGTNSSKFSKNARFSRAAGTGVLLLAVASGAANLMTPADAKATFITFDVPGVTNTFPTTINKNGVIAGYTQPGELARNAGTQPGELARNAGTMQTRRRRSAWVPADGNFGFVRAASGTITTFDIGGQESIEVTDINNKGEITGIYTDQFGQGCFFRDTGGNIAVAAASGITFQCSAINVHSIVVGTFNDSSGDHGLIWNGSTLHQDIFDVPGASNTVANDVNDNGFITGFFTDAGGNVHGFIRSPDGTVTAFDAGSSTNPLGINSAGFVVGIAGKPSSFVRAPDGSITIFDPAGAFEDGALGVNKNSTIVGEWEDNSAIFHGYFRKPDGTIKPFDVPRADETFAAAINNAGAITGTFTKNGRSHGFLRLP